MKLSVRNLVAAIALQAASIAFAGITQQTPLNCTSRNQVLDSKVVPLIDNSASVMIELELKAVKCEGKPEQKGLSVLIQRLSLNSDLNGNRVEYFVVGTESHGNPYDSSTSPHTKSAEGTYGQLGHFCGNKTLNNCARTILGGAGTITDIEQNSYTITVGSSLIPTTQLKYDFAKQR